MRGEEWKAQSEKEYLPYLLSVLLPFLPQSNSVSSGYLFFPAQLPWITASRKEATPDGSVWLEIHGKRERGERSLESEIHAMTAASKLQAFWNHPAGPKTIHFWAPTFKWVISIANVADFTKPPDSISYPQQTVVAVSGLIWSRYSMVIKPRNLNLLGVNMAMAGTGLYQLSRKILHDQLPEEKTR
ncbi:hypothetical protein SAY87_022125 [Trapa incisa]|uniref:Mitochondrial pyruvate carrier n=2 Tax=Trapa TaxID=22665 RepID=A0AAN7MVX3_TRANT|nr:hypothetical protein SAY87_022125 [Trapa incisa]KAK4805027.1 hypothetical protein SAY86_004844 [Trapa natans]